MKNLFLKILIIFATAGAISFAQNNILDKSSYYYRGNNFYIDILNNHCASNDSLTFYFLYKIAYDGLVFQIDDQENYFAIAQIETTFKDKDGITRKRIITEDTVFANNYNETTSRKLYYKNLKSFTLANSQYDTKIKLLNGKHKRLKTFEEKIKTFNSKNKILKPYFLKNIENQKNKFIPFINNGAIPFSSDNFSILLPIKLQKNDKFDFIIKGQNNDKRREIWGEFDSIKGQVDILPNYKLEARQNGKQIFIDLKEKNFTDNTGFLKINLENVSFSPGIYDLTIINKNSKVEKTFTFEVRWDNIPLSLSDVEYAVNAMYYILTDEEFDDINSGDNSEKYRNIIKYWKKYDPTPNTIYNELMDTYFQRVDYALFNYKTLVAKDGAKTDRGKIYILNGKPAKVINEMKGDKNIEVWFYPQLKQKYIFNIISVGNYKLTNIEDIK